MRSARVVGFCGAAGVPWPERGSFSTWINVSAAVARIGVPSGLNMVNCTFSRLHTALKLVNVPQANVIDGGLAWLVRPDASELLTSIIANSASVAEVTSPLAGSASNKRFSVSSRACPPLNWGDGRLDPTTGLTVHALALLIAYSFGLNRHVSVWPPRSRAWPSGTGSDLP